MKCMGQAIGGSNLWVSLSRIHQDDRKLWPRKTYLVGCGRPGSKQLFMKGWTDRCEMILYRANTGHQSIVEGEINCGYTAADP